MRSLRKIFLLGTFITVSACQFEPAAPVRMPTDAEVEQYNASVPPDKRIVCREEKPVTTYIPRRVCRLVIDMEEDSAFTRSELIRAIR